MDQNYLDNLAGSPYITEGLFDKLKSHGAAAAQRFKGISGTGWKSLDKTKLDSLWNSFKKKFSSIVRDFNINVLPNIQKNKPNDVITYQSDINKITKLGKLIFAGPRQFSDVELQRSLSTRRYDDPTNITNKGNQGINFESLNEVDISKLIRPWSLTQALSSNDTGKTIAAYKSYLKKLYSEFVSDVQQVFKLPSSGSVGTSVLNQSPELAPTLNAMEDLIGVPRSTSPASHPQDSPPPVEPPASPVGSVPGQTSAPSAAGQESPAGSDASGASSPTTSSDKLELDVILKTINLIITKIQKDPKGDSHPHFYMRTPIAQWRVVKPTEIPTVTDDPTVTEETETDEKEGFLYKFHQHYRKHTGSFTIRIGTFEHKNKIYEVLWHSFGMGERGHGHNNEIMLKIYDKNDTSKQPKTITLFSFFDHEIDPRQKASENFGVEKLFSSAHPNIEAPFNQDDLAKLKPKEELLHRALFAITDRKSLEFKSQLSPTGKEAVSLMADMGVSELDAEYYISLVQKHIGTDSPADVMATTAYKLYTATQALTRLGHKADDAKKYVVMAVNKLGKGIEQEPQESIVKMAIKMTSPFGPQPPKPPMPEEDPFASDPPIPPPLPATPPVPQPSSTKKLPASRLEKVNDQLKSIGVDVLDNEDQMHKLFSMKGAWNSRIKRKAEIEDNPAALKFMLGDIDNTHLPIWGTLVDKIKGRVSPKDSLTEIRNNELRIKDNKKRNKFINPYVRENWINQ